MVLSTHVHPDVRSLRDFILGKLTDSDQTSEIEAHIESCKDCCAMLEQIGADTFEDLACGRPTELLMSVHHDHVSVADSTEILLQQLRTQQRYEILDVIGRGGMATVFRAQHRLMGRTIALKVLSPTLEKCRETLKRFHQEVRAAGKLKHPNIVTVFDAELIDEKLFLAMEFVKGKTLSQAVESHGTLSIESATACALKVAQALAYSHGQGIIHRDIKPSNIMLTDDGQVKLLDFGLAFLPQSSIDETSGLDSSTSIMGTPNYMSPEQCLAPGTVDQRTDIYSLGCTLFYLLFGRSPHSRNPWAQLIRKNDSKQLVLPNHEKCPLQLQLILKRMLARDPDERFGSMEEVTSALMQFCRRKKYQLNESILIDERNSFRRTLGFVDARTLKIAGWSIISLWAFGIVGYFALRVMDQTNRSTENQGNLDSLAVADDVPLPGKFNIVEESKSKSSSALQMSGAGVIQNLRTIDLGAPVTSLALSREQKLLVIGTGGADGVIRLWDLENMHELSAIRAHREAVWALAVSERRNILASGGQDLRQRSDHAIRITNLSTSQVMSTLTAHTDTVSSLTFYSNDSRLLSTSWDRTACIWDVDELKKKASWTFELPVLACAVRSDDRIAAFSLEDGRIKVVDLESGSELGTLVGHRGRVECVKFLPDKAQLLSAGHDQSVRVWDLDRFELIQSFPAHDRVIRTLQVSADGSLLLTGSFDQSIRLWRLSDGREIGKGLGHANEVTAMLWANGQKRVISGGMDMTVRIWSFEDILRIEQPTANN